METIIDTNQEVIRNDLLLDSDHTLTELDTKYDKALENLQSAKLTVSNIEREQKALNLEVTIIDDKVALVKSQSKKAYYTVNYTLKTCECPDHKYRGVTCKHIIAVLNFLETVN